MENIVYNLNHIGFRISNEILFNILGIYRYNLRVGKMYQYFLGWIHELSTKKNVIKISQYFSNLFIPNDLR